MLETYSSSTVKLLEDAKILASEEMVTTYHLLVAMLNQKETICAFLFTEKNITKEKIISYPLTEQEVSKQNSSFSLEVHEIIQNAATLAAKVKCEYVYDEHLFYALLEHNNNIACKIIEWLEISIEELKADIADIFNFFDRQLQENDMKMDYLLDLSKIESTHKYIVRDDYLNKIKYILAKKQKNNPLLIGKAGVGKTAIVTSLVKLYNYKIYQLDLGCLIAKTKYRGEMEDKVIKAIKQVITDDAILFIDEIHNIVGAGSNEGSLDVANLLKPYLVQGNLKVIAATTLDEYYKYFEKDNALNRRFQNIFISEPNKNQTYTILKGIKKDYEIFHNHHISNKILKQIIYKCHYRLYKRNFPDKAIDVLDEILARTKINKTTPEREINKVISNFEGIKYFNRCRLEKMKLNYPELKPFYLRKIKDKTSYPNLGVVYINNNFSKDALVADIYCVFGLTEEIILELDLDNYSDYTSITNLIGSSKGYIGYDSGGIFTNHLLKYPLSIIIIKSFKTYQSYIYDFFKKLFVKEKIYDSFNHQILLKNTLFLIQKEFINSSIGFIDQYKDRSKNNIFVEFSLQE